MARGGNRGGGRGGGRGRGRGGGGGGGRGRGGGGRGGARGGHHQGVRANFHSSDQKNARLEAYYIDQAILDPSEWGTFMQYLRTPLPTTFRLTAGKETTPQLLKALQDIYIPFLSNVTFDGEKVDPPKTLPWYPDGLGWHLNTKKNFIRKSPEFKRFHQFLVHETDVGSISRQEAVSMLPPLFLDVQPHHLVLDMCAAPGSKTAQLIESLHSPFTSAPSSYNPMPTGLVIANDSDTKRAHMLVHQSQRLPSPNLLVTNLDASNYQSIQVPYKADNQGAEVIQTAIKYDRILADVPCSGDGTIRKNVPIWKEWTPNNAVGLHALQLKILIRGLNQLRQGGRLVYSTCSMNPIENEAVVAEALRRFEGKVRIVDCSSRLPELVRRKGLTTWRAAPGRGAHLFGKSKYAKEKAAKSAADADADADAAAADGEGELVDAYMKDAEGKVDEEVAAAAAAEGDAAAPEEQAAPEPEIGSAEYRDRLPEIAWIDNWDQLNELDADLASRTPKSLWPQGDEEALGTQHCMRLYPHLQDTGGFFVALLEKVGNPEDEGMAAGMIRAMDHLDSLRDDGESLTDTVKRALSPETEADGAQPAAKKLKEVDGTASPAPAAATETETEVAGEVTNVKEDKHAADRARKAAQQKAVNEGHGIPGGLPYKEDPFAYIPPSNDQVQACKKFFDLKDTFPLRNLLVRNEEHQPLRSVYLTSTTARAVITGGGPGRGNHPHMNPISLRLINCGIKSLGRQDAGRDGTLECKWRIISDGLLSIRPQIEERAILKAQLKDLAFLIANHYPVLDTLPGDFGELLKTKKMGSYIIDVLPSEHDGRKLNYKLSFPIWRAVNSVNLMLDKQEKSALSFRIFDIDLSSADGGRQFSSQPSKKDKKANKDAKDAEMQLSDAEDAARAAALAKSNGTTPSSSSSAAAKVELAPYQSEYIQLALNSCILKFEGPYTLKSGRLSPYFFNAGLFNTGAKVTKVAECYAKRIVKSGVQFDVLFGPAYKGIPLAAATAMALQLNHGIDVGFCFNRKEAKTHGEGGSLVGAELKGRVLILDDVITAGTAINEAMDILVSQPSAQLAGVVIALDRQEKSQKDGVPGTTSAITEVEKRYNTKVYSVVTLDQIIEFMKRDAGAYGEKIEKMNEYRIEYGTSEVAKAEQAAAGKS